MICQNDFLYDKAFTHGGVFHADDVFAAAMLRIIKPGIIIERGNTVPEDYDGLVFDIGFGEHKFTTPVILFSIMNSIALTRSSSIIQETI